MRVFVNVLILFLLLANVRGDGEIIPVEEEEEKASMTPVKTSEKFDVSGEEFVATNEWQEVSPNQAIPGGLHVRLNLETGKREAKLMDRQESKSEENLSHGQVLSEELQDTLKQISDASGTLKPEFEELVRQEEVRRKYRSIKKLKEEMNDLNMTMQTDFEIIKDVIAKLNSTDIAKEDKITLLKDLEYYVHQFDNGLLLCDAGGFELILKYMNQTDVNTDLDLQIESLLVLGSAMQGNPKVQIFAIKSGMLQLVLTKLTTFVQSADIEKQDFIAKLVFTLSGMLRNFPFAQSEFLQLGGSDVLVNLIRSPNSLKVKTKVLTLVDDLIKEKLDAINSPTQNDQKVQQYTKVDILGEIIEKNWCSSFEHLLKSASDHDTREKILISMSSLLDNCRQAFTTSSSLRETLMSLQSEYDSTGNDDDLYFAQIKHRVDDILKLVDSNKERVDL